MAEQRKEERGRSGEAAGVDGVSTDTRERQVALPDTKAGERHGEDKNRFPTSGEADLGFS